MWVVIGFSRNSLITHAIEKVIDIAIEILIKSEFTGFNL